MAKTAQYTIVVNGLQQAVDMTSALNKELDILQSKIDRLNKNATIKLKTNGAEAKTEAEQIDKLEKQIAATREKAAEARKKEYVTLLQAKEELKEYQTVAKSLSARESLLIGANDVRTMAGMKAQLKDIKQAMQTLDTGSTEFQEMTEQAASLTQQLKDLEAAYGTFGRNVGNYQSAFEGLKNIVIQIGDTERQFGSVREASRTLNEELKAMVINGQDDTEEFAELSDAVHKFNLRLKGAESAVNDLKTSSQGMDDLLDTFESLASLASVGQGIKGFLGLDNTEIERSIQKMVALQNILQGIEKIKQQLNAGDGWFAKGNKEIDDFAKSLFGVKEAEEGVAVASTAASRGATLLANGLKLLKGVGIVAGIMLVTEAISKIAQKIGEWIKGNSDLVSSEKILDSQLKLTNDELQRKLQLNEKMRSAGLMNSNQQRISDEKAYADAISSSSKLIQQQINLLSKRNEFRQGFNGTSKDFDTSNIEALRKRWEELTKAVEEGRGEIIKSRDGLDTYQTTATATRDRLADLELTLGGKLVRSMMKFDVATEEGRNQLQQFVKGIQDSDDEMMKSVLMRLPSMLEENNPQLAKALNGYLDLVNDFVGKFNASAARLDWSNFFNTKVRLTEKEQLKKDLDEIEAKADELRRKQGGVLTAQQAGEYDRLMREAKERYEKSVADSGKKVQATVKKDNQERLRQERLLQESRILIMEDGLRKELELLRKERDEKLAQGRNEITDLVKRKEYEANINAAYAKREQEARKKAAEELRKLEGDISKQLMESVINNIQGEADKTQGIIDDIIEKLQSTYKTLSFDDMFASDEIEEAAIGVAKLGNGIKVIEENIRAVQKEMANTDDPSKLVGLEARYNELLHFLEEAKATYAYAGEENAKKYGEAFIKALQKFDSSKAVFSSLGSLVNQSIDFENILSGNIDNLVEERGNIIAEQTAKLIEEYRQQEKETKDHYANLRKQDEDAAKEAREQGKEYVSRIDEINLEEEQALQHLKEALDRAKKMVVKGVNETFSANLRGVLTQQMDLYSDFINEMQGKLSKAQVLTKFGFINTRETKRNLDRLKTDINGAFGVIERRIESVNQLFDKGLISDKDYTETMRQLRGLQDAVKGVSTQVGSMEAETRNAPLEKLQLAVSTIANTMSQAFSSLWDYQDREYDYQLEKLNDFIEKYGELLDKQKEITEEHANSVNDIESELATARGDRRQELIDQLNAQIEAQRASLQAEREYEEQQKTAQRQADALEKARLKKQKQRDLITATINTAVAATNALATKPWALGLALFSVASALGAFQIAMIKKSKYAKGGLLEGPSHANGGIPVGHTGIEVEGGEYIVNKKSTAANLDLLEAINKSKTKIKLGEKNKFADGGQLPSMRNDSFGNQDLATAMAEYAERPVYVQVVDIASSMDRLARVQTLAGANS